jgi:hypothetical protein
MDAAFLTPREAVATGIPKSTAHRIKDAMAASVQGQILVVDGAVITSSAALIELLNALSSRATAAELELVDVRTRAIGLDQELQLVRHELDVQRDRSAALSPRLAAVAAQVAQLLDENLNAPESKLTD